MQVRTVTVRESATQGKRIIVTRADGDTLPLGGPRLDLAFLPEFSATSNHASAAEHFAWEQLHMTSPSATNGRHLGYGSYLWDVTDLAEGLADDSDEQHPDTPTNADLWRD